jgi:hypothetical protein
MFHRLVVVILISLGGVVPLSGCGKRLPPIVPVQGTVLLNDNPLPKASVTFVPQLDNFGAESNSAGITDEDGHFSLTCAYNNQPGAVVGTHVVVVTDPPMPAEMRRVQDMREQNAYLAKLGNRPIPPQYSSPTRSPIRIEIKQGQEPVKIELTR